MLLLAMSCLQARTQDAALDELLRHAPDGVQLTPGNLPSPGFRERVAAAGVAVRLHHGFAFDRYRQRVYAPDGEPLLRERDRSLHPPRAVAHGPHDPVIADPRRWLERARVHDLLLETMYPGYLLGDGAQLSLAMDLGIRLAVDASHLHIQRCQGALDARTERRVLDYERVEEVHVSANDGRADRHQPLTPDTPGLAWARERIDRLPVVVESYWHRLSFDQQRRQLDLLRAGHGAMVRGE